MNKILLTTLAIVAMLGSAAAKLSFGRCPEPSLKAGFDKLQYVGTWFEYARDKSILFEYGDCS
jgi:lipocalin